MIIHMIVVLIAQEGSCSGLRAAWVLLLQLKLLCLLLFLSILLLIDLSVRPRWQQQCLLLESIKLYVVLLAHSIITSIQDIRGDQIKQEYYWPFRCELALPHSNLLDSPLPVSQDRFLNTIDSVIFCLEKLFLGDLSIVMQCMQCLTRELSCRIVLC